MKRQENKYSRPFRPYDRARLEEESVMMKEYGMRRKKEIWRSQEILRNFRQRARQLAAVKDEKEEKSLIKKVSEYGLVSRDANLDNILALNIKNILDRRLQTIVLRKGMCNTSKQARQFIVHGHIALDGKRICWPSALIKTEEESKISFYEKSANIKDWIISTRGKK